VQAVLAARIDLLGPAEKAALQAAAVIGRVFWSGPVYELLESLRPDLRVLEEREFIRRRPGSTLAGETEFSIKHALTREVAYTSLPKARRARLHAAFARWVERVGEGRDEYVPVLAHHYAEAVRPEDAGLVWGGAEAELAALRGRAIACLRRAAELSASRYALGEAVGLLHRALELDPDRAERAELWRAVARAHALAYHGERFWEAMAHAIEDCEDPALEADLQAELAPPASSSTAGSRRRWRRLRRTAPREQGRSSRAATGTRSGRMRCPRRARRRVSPSRSATPSSGRTRGPLAGSSTSRAASSTSGAAGPSDASRSSTSCRTRTTAPTSTTRRSRAASGAGASARRAGSRA
jgi:hypothetical protein